MKLRRISICAIYVFAVIVLFHSILSDNWYGFGVDSYGKVYIGDEDCINVLENDEVVHSITIPPHRSYYFTVQTDDTILICTENYLFVVDYLGNTLSSKYDSGASEYTKLMHLREIETANGDRYICRSFLGRRFVEDENGIVIYEVPFIEYFSSIVYALPFVLLATIVFLSEWDKIGKTQNK